MTCYIIYLCNCIHSKQAAFKLRNIFRRTEKYWWPKSYHQRNASPRTDRYDHRRSETQRPKYLLLERHMQLWQNTKGYLLIHESYSWAVDFFLLKRPPSLSSLIFAARMKSLSVKPPVTTINKHACESLLCFYVFLAPVDDEWTVILGIFTPYCMARASAFKLIGFP